MTPEYQFSVLRTVEELDGLAQEWRELRWPWMMPLLDFAWIRANAVHFYAPGDLHVIAAYRRGKLVAVAPLARARGADQSSLEFIGASFTRGPCGLPYCDEIDHFALLGFIWSLREPLKLRRWVVDPRLAPAGRVRAGRAGVRVMGRSIRMPVLTIGGTWEQYLKGLSSQRRYDIRRAQKRLHEIGEVQVSFTTPGPAELDCVLEQAFQLEAAGWKGRNGTAILDNAHLSAFYRDIARAYAATGDLVIAFLQCEEEPVATQIALHGRHRYWLLKVGFDEAFSRASPGFLLMTEAVRYAHERKYASVEFLGSDEPWLRAWTTEVRECLSAHFLPYSLQGVRATMRLVARRGRASDPERVAGGEQE